MIDKTTSPASQLNQQKKYDSSSQSSSSMTKSTVISQFAGCKRKVQSSTKKSCSSHTCNFKDPHSNKTCGKIYAHKTSLVRHKNKHNDKKVYTCGYKDINTGRVCQRTFKRIDNRKSHYSKHDPKNPTNKCFVCNTQFTTAEKLNKHLDNQHPEVIAINKPFKCIIIDTISGEPCNGHFTSESKLKQHQKVHTKDVYTCDHFDEVTKEICLKVFKTEKQREDHLITHSENKPFSCHACDLSYTERRNLNRHIQIKHNPRIPSSTGKQQDLSSFEPLAKGEKFRNMSTQSRPLTSGKLDQHQKNQFPCVSHNSNSRHASPSLANDDHLPFNQQDRSTKRASAQLPTTTQVLINNYDRETEALNDDRSGNTFCELPEAIRLSALLGSDIFFD